MRTRFLSILLLLLLQPTLGEADFVALICDLKGTAEWRADSQTIWQSASILGRLGDRAELRLDAGTTVTINFVRGGSRATLLGPCRAELSEESVRLLEGDPQSLSVLKPKKRVGTLYPKALNLNRMGGLVRPQDSGEPRWTTDAVVLPGKNRLTWQTSPRYRFYQVELTSDADEQTSVLERTEESGVETLLDADTIYLVSLRAYTAGNETPDFSWNGSLETLSEACRDELSRQPRESVTDKVILLSHLVHLELYQPARELCREIVAQRPDEPLLQELLQSLVRFGAARGL